MDTNLAFYYAQKQQIKSNTHVGLCNTVKNTKNYTIHKTMKRLHYTVSIYLPDTASNLANRHVQTMNILLVCD